MLNKIVEKKIISLCFGIESTPIKYLRETRMAGFEGTIQKKTWGKWCFIKRFVMKKDYHCRIVFEGDFSRPLVNSFVFQQLWWYRINEQVSLNWGNWLIIIYPFSHHLLCYYGNWLIRTAIHIIYAFFGKKPKFL